MDPTFIGILGIVCVFMLLLSKMPIGFAMAFVGFLGICAVMGVGPAFSNMAVIPIRQASSYIMSAIPLFVLMGLIASQSGLSTNAFYAVNKWVGHWRGGLAISAIGGSAAFGAVCGDIVSASVTMCTVCLPEMRKYRYRDEMSLGCIAAGGNLSFLIPPSIGFIIYAILTEVSIGSLFTAGIFPGILLAFLFALVVTIRCRINPKLAPVGPRANWKDRISSLRELWGFLFLILLVLGGIYGGIFTPTEAGAIGAFGAFVLGIFKRKFSWQAIGKCIGGTASITGMIFTLIIGAMIFNTFMVVTEIPLSLTNFIAELDTSPYLILIIILAFYILIGFVMDIMSIIMLTVPVLHPLLVGLGFDPVWVGVLVLLTIVIGQISPPFGMIVFVLSGVVKDVPLYIIFRGAFPFLMAMVVGLIILIIFPDIALFLPAHMR